jgi:hypothetical protein
MQGRKGEGTGGIYTKPEPEQLIKMYQKGYSELRLFGRENIDKTLADILVRQAEIAGAPTDKIKAIRALFDTGKMTIGQLGDQLFKLMSKPQKTETTTVEEKTLTNHLNHGWEYIGATPSGKCIIRRSI